MAYSGLHIPVKENSKLFVFDNIYADIGDEQSIDESLSTFSSHIKTIINILNTSTTNSLVLLDELGSGTDPIEGANLAISILEQLHKTEIITLSTTHYQEIKNYALVTKGFENASCEFDIENLKPTYNLLVGVPGKSYAFSISQRLGLPENIINRAMSLLNDDHISIEELLKNIYDMKLEIEKEKEEISKNSAQIESLRISLEKKKNELYNKEKELLDDAKQKARKILLDAKDDANEIIKKLENSLSSTKTANELRDNLNNKIASISKSPSSPKNNNLTSEDIKIGMCVLVIPLNQKATVLSLPNSSQEVQVQINQARMNVKIKDLAFANCSDNKSVASKGHVTAYKNNLEKAKHVSTEINVIGYNIEEANFVIDKFLDDCYLAKLSPVRIVHGKGSGKLRQGIHTFLQKCPIVKSFRIGSFGEGEMGVTVVELK